MTNAVPSNQEPVDPEPAEVWLMPVFTARAGHERELQSVLSSLQAESRKDAGCLEYTVFADMQRPGTYVMFEGWARLEDLEDHNQQQHVKDFVEAVKPLLEVPFSVTTLEPLA
ncbi:putative quinol monooxygenase [Paenarthrobacter sp. NPDC057355]|uniref:putative quinol monooxygenase n=1 Tax=Paenarthrobacter sp. NPDC057355 TaxID=3346105 RepID=UPI003639F004